MKEMPYSKEYWKAIDNPPPKKRVIDRVVDAIQLSIHQRRVNRMFEAEFKKLEKEKMDDSHYMP